MRVHAQIALSSDEAVFGGWENVSKKYDVDYQTQEVNIWQLLYLCSLIGCVLCLIRLPSLCCWLRSLRCFMV